MTGQQNYSFKSKTVRNISIHVVFRLIFFLAFILTFLILSCSNQYSFAKDSEILKQFKVNKPIILEALKACKELKERKNGKELTGSSHFENCPIPKELHNKYGIKFISIELKLDPQREAQLKKIMKDNFEPYQDRALVTTNYFKDEGWTINVREKGYLYSRSPLKESNIVDQSLDQMAVAEYRKPNESRNKEVWRYRQIEPHWYLYFRYLSQATL